VIAYGKGGVLETVVPANDGKRKSKPTGLFFFEQNAKALAETVREFSNTSFDHAHIQKHAEGFRSEKFRTQFQSMLKGISRDHTN